MVFPRWKIDFDDFISLLESIIVERHVGVDIIAAACQVFIAALARFTLLNQSLQALNYAYSAVL